MAILGFINDIDKALLETSPIPAVGLRGLLEHSNGGRVSETAVWILLEVRSCHLELVFME